MSAPHLHTVRATLRNKMSEDNKIFVDDMEITNVTEFYVKAVVGKRASVTLTFFANFDGDLSNAQDEGGGI